MLFVIRPARIEDALGMNELRRMPGVFENISGIPSENLQKNEDFLRNLDINSHHFVAVTDDDAGKEKVIGSAGLTVYPNPRQRLSAGIGLMVHKDYQGQGIGDKLLSTLLDVADNWLMLVRVELTVYTDNERAIALYKKHGFEQEGIKRKSSIRNGKHMDELMMARVKGFDLP
ncbi:MAG: GNAT family N-acetyltransferase [Clostridiales bacterium]|nr:GNAT family N-acetyltransferase [Clostridiales bacterium]